MLGPVFRTYEPTRDRLVAVKVFRLDITPEQAQALADALALASEAGLFHPSVVEPIAAGVEGTVAYRAEEYVAAESLDVAMRHYAPAAIDKVLPFITQLAGAIDFARTAGVGHGALHPRDIFVTPDEARATGFGVVEALERVGLRAPVRRPYSAPERVEGREWSTPADVFSLAAITYELLTGRRPAGTGDQIGQLTEYTGDHADALHAVLAQAMDDDPSQRYPKALGFVAALEAAAAQGTTQTQGATEDLAAVAAIAPAMTLDRETADPLAADLIDDSVADMPPLVPLDEQEAPAEAAIEEEVFHAEQDIDELDVVLRQENAARAPLDLFDDEDVEDLAQPPPAERFSRDFDPSAMDEPAPLVAEMAQESARDEEPLRAALAAPVFASADPTPTPVPARGYSSITDPAVVPERQRPAVLPYAIVGILTLLLGFGAGYAYATRKASQEGVALRTGAAATEGQGKEFSEQTVAPSQPAADPGSRGEPPSLPAEAPPPSAPRATARTPTSGSITITSAPPKAAVTVDGTWRGRTPLTLDNLKFGSYTIRIVQEGYRVERHVVPLNAQSPSRSIAATLQRLPGAAAANAPQPGAGSSTLYVDSRPRGARVLLDDKFVGITPLQLPDVPAGRHRVRLELPDHQTWLTTAVVTSGRDTRVTGSLERIR